MQRILFPKLKFDAPGVYKYTLKELTPSGGGWLTDKRVFRIVVTVTEDDDGKLAATVGCPDGSPVFVNKYCKTKCVISCCCKRDYCPHCSPKHLPKQHVPCNGFEL